MASQTQPSHVGSDGVVRCLHRLEAASFVCKNGDNKGKRFFKCYKHPDTKDTCNFWKWEHDLFPPQEASETQNPSPPATPQKRHAVTDTTKRNSKRARFELLVVTPGDSDSSDGVSGQPTQQILPTPPPSVQVPGSGAVKSRRRRDEDQEDSDPGEDTEDGTYDRDNSPSPADRMSRTNDLQETFKNAMEVANIIFDEVNDRADRQKVARSESSLVQEYVLSAGREENERLKKELRECREENERNQETILNLSRALDQALKLLPN